ncbi:hypothetical protein JK215_03110 [Tatumella sp. JGM100]|nr:hypothetical protein [Tatumella sp. JGM82]MBS0892064.1 hypothetical protein [Tatumella sp. JGM94]MBS0900843.1 hypothetical protein [Tatumella sp. JGM100]
MLEGFFHEEYEFYLKNKNTKKPKQLSGLINTLLHAHNINIRDQKKRMNVINMITLLRNSVVHSNGTLNTDFNKEKCEKILGEDLFKHSDSYPRLTLTKSLWLLREYQSIAHEYSKAVFDKATEHEASCLGQSDMN